MKRELVGLNLVVVFREPGKHMIEHNKLTTLLPEQNPTLSIWPPDPLSPGVVEYQKNGLTITVLENRLQIQTKAVEGEIPPYFSDVLGKVLQAARERDIRAYGFNFDFKCADLKEVKELFGIQVKTTTFQHRPGTRLKLTFEKGELLFGFELADDQPASYLHINVHHEEATKAHLLAEKIANELQKDFEEASELIKEVLGDAEKTE